MQFITTTITQLWQGELQPATTLRWANFVLASSLAKLSVKYSLWRVFLLFEFIPHPIRTIVFFPGNVFSEIESAFSSGLGWLITFCSDSGGNTCAQSAFFLHANTHIHTHTRLFMKRQADVSQISLHNHVLWYVDTQSVLVLSSLLFKINGVCLFFRLPGAKNETEAGRNVGETTAVMFLQLFITETCCVCWINEFTLKIWASRAFYKAMQGGARSFGFQSPTPMTLTPEIPTQRNA